MEIRLLHNKFPLLKNQLGFHNGFMVDRVGFGCGLILLWRHDLSVSLRSYSNGHIDVWISNWLPTGGCFLIGFYGHCNPTLRKQSWELLKRR